VEPGSLEWKVKFGELFLVKPDGPELMVVSGGPTWSVAFADIDNACTGGVELVAAAVPFPS